MKQQMQHKGIKAVISTPALSGSTQRDTREPKTLESRLTAALGVGQGGGYQSDLKHSKKE